MMRCLWMFAALAASFTAGAAEWRPASPVEIVVPNAPGGGNDAVGRVMQRIWQERKWVTPSAFVTNKTGGGGSVAITYLGQKSNDPQVMAVVSITQQLNYIAGNSPRPHREFTPLAILIGDYIGYAVKADSPITNGRDLIERLKKDPASINAGVTAIGGNNHVAYVMAARAAGVDTRRLKTPVFQSSGESLTALLGGHIDMHIGSVGPLTKHVDAGRVRLIAVTSERRLTGAFANVPTWKEQGIAGTFNTWRGVWAPKGLSAEQIAYWDSVFERLSKDPQWRETLDANHWENDFKPNREAVRYLDALHGELREAMKDLGLAKRLD